MTERPVLYRRFVCHVFATGGVKALHRFAQTHNLRAQIDISLAHIAVAKQVTHFVKLEPAFMPPRARFSSQIMELEIDPAERGAAFRR